eukprot:TRINITY_DN2845_c0_g1_i1.p1 TRINITY_DN2845_c0_g1~~TRINITY_DN2845_c0_g1_i1.p1  ORF type:complete len:308 (+),score=75.09 TRINITY_DN2845_c0_g1_i1:214-1137(+)
MWFWILLIVFANVVYRQWKKSNKKDIKGQVVLITGGAGGIGKQMALRFAKLKCKIVLWDVNEELLKKAASQIKSETGVSVNTYIVDVTKRDIVYKTADQVRKDVGKVDILVNNAGIVSGKSILAPDFDDARAELTIAVNTTSHIWTVRAFAPDMVRTNRGHVVTIASAAGLCGVVGLADYCASKFGAVGFDESLRREFRHKKLTGCFTTCVCPFYINTGMFEGVGSKTPFLKILDEGYVADSIVGAVLENREFLGLPGLVHYTTHILNGILPTFVNDNLQEILGVSDTMSSFVQTRVPATPAASKSK